MIKRPIVTEKTAWLAEQKRTYTFLVSTTATKPEIAQAVSQKYNVTVERVRTMTRHSETRRFRGLKVESQEYKRALVTVVEGQQIPLY